MIVLNCFYKTFLCIIEAADMMFIMIFGVPGNRGPQLQSRMNWLVGLLGGGCAGAPHYAVDYPLLSTATVKLLSPLLWG